MDFGKFLFLYFVARNTSYFVSENILREVKRAYFGPERLPLKDRNGDEESMMTPSESSELPPYEQVGERSSLNARQRNPSKNNAKRPAGKKRRSSRYKYGQEYRLL